MTLGGKNLSLSKDDCYAYKRSKWKTCPESLDAARDKFRRRIEEGRSPGANCTRVGEFPAHDLYFVGDTSPFGHILQSVVGTKRMVEEALSFNPFLVIVDTSGLVTGAFGQALKYYKAQAINPDHVVSLQRGNELREILYTLSKSGEWKLHNLPVSSKAKHISPLIRAGVRRERFRRYFGRSNSFSLNLAGISLYPPLPDFLDRADLKNILVSLKNRQGRVLGIGILRELIREENRFEVLAPIPPESEIFGVELGFLKVSRDGRELGRAHHHR